VNLYVLFRASVDLCSSRSYEGPPRKWPSGSRHPRAARSRALVSPPSPNCNLIHPIPCGPRARAFPRLGKTLGLSITLDYYCGTHPHTHTYTTNTPSPPPTSLAWLGSPSESSRPLALPELRIRTLSLLLYGYHRIPLMALALLRFVCPRKASRCIGRRHQRHLALANCNRSCEQAKRSRGSGDKGREDHAYESGPVAHCSVGFGLHLERSESSYREASVPASTWYAEHLDLPQLGD
jgi:hypothetical protein